MSTSRLRKLSCVWTCKNAKKIELQQKMVKIFYKKRYGASETFVVRQVVLSSRKKVLILHPIWSRECRENRQQCPLL